ncbi:MAG: PhoPQ-activated protein PqaA family protein [Fimbriimonadaceae bacterium]
MMWATALSLVLAAQAEPSMLADYLAKPNDAFDYEVSTVDGRTEISLTSQTWQGEPWEHDLVVVKPENVEHEGAGVLYITGNRSDDREVTLLQSVANQTGVPIAVLYDVPNQPLYGKSEDELIAHTFVRYLETGDASWPLLFPMTQSAISAMNALEEELGLEKFVVSGASKRGWTTWLTAASGDERVAGIAPLVIDNLNIPLQMDRQRQYWGEPSAEVSDYTDSGLLDMINDPEVQPLIQAADPFTYIDDLRLPKLIVNGANDPYWTVDALNAVWKEIPAIKNAVVVPNVGHSIEDYNYWMPTLAQFVSATFENRVLPQVEVAFNQASPAAVQASWQNVPGIQRVNVWRAVSPDLRFEDKQWEVVGTISPDGFDRQVVPGPIEYDKNNAYFAEIRVDDGEGGYYRITSPVHVFRRS